MKYQYKAHKLVMRQIIRSGKNTSLVLILTDEREHKNLLDTSYLLILVAKTKGHKSGHPEQPRFLLGSLTTVIKTQLGRQSQVRIPLGIRIIRSFNMVANAPAIILHIECSPSLFFFLCSPTLAEIRTRDPDHDLEYLTLKTARL